MENFEDLFTRPPTNAEKAALILYLLDVGLPEWTEDENLTLYYVLAALAGTSLDVSQRAFEDAIRFGMANKKDEQEYGENS